MEQKFGQEKSNFIQRSGKANISSQIRVRRIFKLKIQNTSLSEIESYIDSPERSYSRDKIHQRLTMLKERQEFEKKSY
ncbi:MAG: hypothetical protein K9W44_14720 [Candidatus Lokiarchaeota archaeon]|nr:hypothetical protein [Candidatus Harpocratesius repetitus]